ncbi:hypothetical protein GCM10011351_27270 [Paraliobacillus quinghaiensis]|uniref:Diguanylate cyclase n=1 Tax=Paraliobacillus quinghaiensis TaxID=470815 RepID=A0A917WYE2_9BACI|nr:EAL domain-containing protein [Paraliobacillus quinghaiensis]GGM39671.1 hypothetical protein GCM10011351_27270 [Paraliobacillus quinghaiensis]
MWSTKRSAIVSIFVISILFYSCLLLFKNNELIRSLIVFIRPLGAGTLSFFWLYKAYRLKNDKQRYFWLLLSIGVLFYISSNTLWMLSFLVQGLTIYSDLSFLLWIMTYIIFLIALIYKIKVINTSISTSRYIFTIFVFMTFVVSIVTHYFVNPILIASGNSLVVTTSILIYTIASLSILFVIINLYYLSLFSKDKEVMVFIVSGFLLQVIADMYHSYLNSYGEYQQGSFVDFIWLTALLMIGVAGKFAQTNSVELDWKIINYFQNKESIFPYLTVITLMILVPYSYDWDFNALSTGLSIIFLMIIIRQLIVMKKNKKLVSEYRYLAYHDSLTGLKNRTAFIEDLAEIMNKAKKSDRSVALLLMDLDRFKNVNDTLGHHIGDLVLRESAAKLKRTLHEEAVIYRIGGDEFVIVLPNISKSDCVTTADIVLDIFRQPFSIEFHEISITPSIGISLYPTDGLDSQELLKYADSAMYVAKEKGNRYHFFDAALNAYITRRMIIEVELKKAIDRNELVLFYQPKIKLSTGEMVGMEALLRWDHPKLGSISPTEFIPVAEETGQITAIGEWVLRTACHQNKVWQDQGFQSLSVSVNVSARQFEQGDFIKIVEKALYDSGLNPKFLELEITESIMQNTCESIQALKEVRELGVKTSIDDFGTGYSSLHVLKELPIDTIKIDKSFIDDIENKTNLSIIKTIIDIGLNLNLDIIAEGIEMQEQFNTLDRLNCGYGQGYLFSRPVPANEFQKKISDEMIAKKNYLIK